jgi:hypothetical protein
VSTQRAKGEVELRASKKRRLTQLIVAGLGIVLAIPLIVALMINDRTSTALNTLNYKGRVIDANTDAPIQGANVFLTIPGTPQVLPGNTDSEGIFNFSLGVKANTLGGKLSVEASGYNNYQRELTLSEATGPVDIRLERSQPKSEQKYIISVSCIGNRTIKQTIKSQFEKSSETLYFRCLQTRSVTVAWDLPSDARLIERNAEWVDLENASVTFITTLIVGNKLTAKGVIEGSEKYINIGKCPEGHGRVRLWGTYEYDQLTPVELPNKLFEPVVLAGTEASLSIPYGRDFGLAKCTVQIKSEELSNVFDSIEINLPVSPNQSVEQTSKQGRFMATLKGSQLTIKKVEEQRK